MNYGRHLESVSCAFTMPKIFTTEIGIGLY